MYSVKSYCFHMPLLPLQAPTSDAVTHHQYQSDLGILPPEAWSWDSSVAAMEGEWEQLKDEWDNMMGEDDAPSVEGLLMNWGTLVFGVFSKAVTSAKPAQKIDWQKIDLPQRSKIEQGFARYSALGRVLITVVKHGVGALPFGAPVAAVLGSVFDRVDKVGVPIVKNPAAEQKMQGPRLHVGITLRNWLVSHESVSGFVHATLSLAAGSQAWQGRAGVHQRPEGV
jgi:hypothetical protein